jgi:hypothetical protein
LPPDPPPPSSSVVMPAKPDSFSIMPHPPSLLKTVRAPTPSTSFHASLHYPEHSHSLLSLPWLPFSIVGHKRTLLRVQLHGDATASPFSVGANIVCHYYPILQISSVLISLSLSLSRMSTSDHHWLPSNLPPLSNTVAPTYFCHLVVAQLLRWDPAPVFLLSACVTPHARSRTKPQRI